MISSKMSINHLAYICGQHGLEDIVFSSGSRNAPVVIAFTHHGGFNCYSIPDERVAAFAALGMSLASEKPSIICCTSGSAAANYSPAICEAYYQGVPMLVLTADRPEDMIDQGIGQSIRQKDMYRNFIKGSFQLIEEPCNEEQLRTNDQMIQEAILLCRSGFPGPVHINLPFSEPLYETSHAFIEDRVSLLEQDKSIETGVSHSDTGLLERWQGSRRKLILYGQDRPGKEQQAMLQQLAKRSDVVLLTETTSNCAGSGAIGTIDRVITTFEGEELKFIPDLLITMGGPVISKKIKKLFTDHKPVHHIDVRVGEAQNTFKSLGTHVRAHPVDVLQTLLETPSPNDDAFQNGWYFRLEHVRERHKLFLHEAPWSDLKAFDHIINAIPSGWHLHTANSTPVRYAQLFDPRKDIRYHANRGVSGIDGCSSTALGFALKNPDEFNVLVTGDLAFFYDSNAFFHSHIPENLRIIMINNGGGGIFRIIEGPSTTEQLDHIFESVHQHNGRNIAMMYDFPYRQAHDSESFTAALSEGFFDPGRLKMIEVSTPRTQNDAVLSAYFKSLTP